MGKILGISNSLVTLCVQFYYTKNLGGISNYNMDISRTPPLTLPPPFDCFSVFTWFVNIPEENVIFLRNEK